MLGHKLWVEPPQVLRDDIVQLCSKPRSTRLQLQQSEPGWLLGHPGYHVGQTQPTTHPSKTCVGPLPCTMLQAAHPQASAGAAVIPMLLIVSQVDVWPDTSQHAARCACRLLLASPTSHAQIQLREALTCSHLHAGWPAPHHHKGEKLFLLLHTCTRQHPVDASMWAGSWSTCLPGMCWVAFHCVTLLHLHWALQVCPPSDLSLVSTGQEVFAHAPCCSHRWRVPAW